jgi:hypothetical protein
MTRKVVVLGSLLAVAVLAWVVTLASSGGQRPTLEAASFRTAREPDWWLTTWIGPRGGYRYQLGSTRAAINGLRVPPAGAAAITIDEAPRSLATTPPAAGRAPNALTSTARPVALLPSIVGVPRGARDVTHAPPRTIELGGAEAGEESYAYTYHGRANVQVDILGARRGHLVLVELDAEPAPAAKGKAVLETLTRSWAWR